MRLCSTIWIGGLLAASALHAAEASGAPRKITSVVKTDPRTGRLVRSVVVTPKTVAPRAVAENVVTPRVVTAGEPAPAPDPIHSAADIGQTVERIAAQNDLTPDLLHSVIKVESNYNPYAVSSKGALGMMQLIPATARRFGVNDVFDPVENIKGGARYLRYLLDLFKGNYPLALAAYNAGEGAVAKFGGVPPYRETQNYLQLVYKQLEKKSAAKPAAPVVKQPEPPRDPNAPPGIREIVGTDGMVRYVSGQ